MPADVDPMQRGAADSAAPPGRVLLVTSNFPRWPGDSTTPFVLHIAQDLISLGWHVRVLAPHAPGALRDETIDGVSIRRFRYMWPQSQQVLCYNGGALINLRRDWLNLLRVIPFVICEGLAILSEVIRGRFDVIHSHWLLPQGFTAGIVSRLLRVPHVATIHGGDVFALQSGVLRMCKKLALRFSDAVTVNSSATAAAVERIARPARLVQIPIGVSEHDADALAVRVRAIRARYRRDDGPLVVFVGRLVDEKGVDDLLHAIATVVDRLPHVTALVMGEGPARPALETLAQQLGIADRVHLTGWVPHAEVRAHLAAGDIFVGPSRRSSDGWVEAQGLVFLEAMLAGVPVVATASGGIIDTVRQEETGLLVDERSPSQIADAIVRLCNEPELADRLRRAGRQLVLDGYTRGKSARAFAREFTLSMRQPSRQDCDRS
ncbi:glycosyltransferase involved in cell wall biosynthesis [Povalibacter uvarum]|uniref:Glycosyltransferase involved in cell wall biosynthesis n=1 Tax=Povalibacter uvarum TaxID=732238 RepID=A0A841HSD0_9GAMM|nr:glycosyltransferase family 4 protein [Povalibacter uvarum]MBB6094922.1 glycosyltransferase involved in cell wall biosynthesis [Povalibacter uvarum]